MPNDLTASSASSTMDTFLGVKVGTGTTYKKLIDIKDFPDMGGSPEKVETTTLSNHVSTFVNGVQSMSSLEFLSNYTLNDYTRVKKFQDGQVYEFCLVFGKTVGSSGETVYGGLGAFTWSGALSAWLVGGGVNGVREMRTSISATTEVELSSTITFDETLADKT
jgi:hypothetical protein